MYPEIELITFSNSTTLCRDFSWKHEYHIPYIWL